MFKAIQFLGIYGDLSDEELQALPEGSHLVVNNNMYVVIAGEGKKELRSLSIPRIVCAAAKFENDIVIPSPRHFDRTYHNLFDLLNVNGALQNQHRPIQGFIDQYGCFYNRKWALSIATAAGQIDPEKKTWPINELFSEDLY